jgi:polyhydroxybutyrate depolymerase
MVAIPRHRHAARHGGLVMLLCLVALVAGCVAGTPPAPTPTRLSSTAVTTPAAETIEVGGRPVLLRLPPDRAPGSTTALVVVLHGYTGEAAQAVAFFGLGRLAQARGWVLAAPQGTTDSDGRTFWNAARACCDFHGSAVDDSAHLSAVISTLVATQQVDPERVYVIGHSNGGFMAHRMACEHADQVAAIASLAGALDSDAECRPSRPVSVLQVHGTADDTIAYGGGEIAGREYTSAAGTTARWRRTDACTADGRSGTRLDAEATVPGAETRATTWTGCRGGTEVALWTIRKGGHVPMLTPAFTSALFDWLEQHRRR